MDQNTNTPHEKYNGIATASMILGIISLLFCCNPFICFPFGITSIVLAAMCLVKRSDENGMAIAGLIYFNNSYDYLHFLYCWTFFLIFTIIILPKKYGK